MQNPTTIRVVELEQALKGIERRPDIPCLFSDDNEMIVLPVIGKRGPETVKDAPARRCHQPHTHAILISQHFITSGIDHLKLV